MSRVVLGFILVFIPLVVTVVHVRYDLSAVTVRALHVTPFSESCDGRKTHVTSVD